LEFYTEIFKIRERIWNQIWFSNDFGILHRRWIFKKRFWDIW
jgi:hypothetical protein